MGAPLVKTRTVLHRCNDWPKGPGRPIFAADNEEDMTRMTRVELDVDVYGDMDRPETITVTIEPGDLLNE